MKAKDLIEKLSEIPFIRLRLQSKFHDTIDFFWNATGKSELYTLSPQTKEIHQVTSGELAYYWCVRSPDKKFIYYGKDVEGNEQFATYQLNLLTKEVQLLSSSHEFNEGPSDISPDGKFLLLLSKRTGQHNLFKMDLTTKQVTQLTDQKNPFRGYALWSVKDWIYYSANETDERRNLDIWAVRADGKENHLLYRFSPESREWVLDLSRDGNYLVVDTNGKKTRQAGVLNLATNEITWFGNEQYDENPKAISRDNSKLLTIRFKGLERIPVVYDVQTGEEHVLNVKGVVIEGAFCLNDNYIAYARSDPKTPMSLALYNLLTDEEEIILKPELGIPEEQMINGTHITYPSFDGLKIPAVLYKPKIERGQKAPALMFHPGGPGGQLSLLFLPILQIFSQLGFVILGPSPRGSVGFGIEYLKANVKDLGGGDAMDYVYGKKYLESLPYVDSSRIGVFGGSYGGYMTYILMTKYAEYNWAAGAAMYGITHWKTVYDEFPLDYKLFFEGLLGKYEENKELWEDRSPLNHVDKVNAPILMIQGVNDPRCTISQSRLFKQKLLDLGKQEGTDFEYHEFGDVGHGGREVSKAIEENKLLVDFFLRKLK
ncbi:MAG: S9 family peptidase [Candidatus Heimdallarchaeota archaeon]|nr:S9 family peptidase [Candidatus Heimdallarchaeota archaeon]